jgi:hypothetical protein
VSTCRDRQLLPPPESLAEALVYEAARPFLDGLEVDGPGLDGPPS